MPRTTKRTTPRGSRERPIPSRKKSCVAQYQERSQRRADERHDRPKRSPLGGDCGQRVEATADEALRTRFKLRGTSHDERTEDGPHLIEQLSGLNHGTP